MPAGKEGQVGNVRCYFSNGVELLLSESGRKLRIPVARQGTFLHPAYGLVTFSDRDFDDIIENFDADETGFRPYLRYGHARYPEAVDAEPAVAYLEALQKEDGVLWGVYDPLNDEVVEQVKSGAYAHSSAEIRRQAVSKRDGRPIGTLLTACALTNAPFVPDLPQNQVLSDAAGAASYITLCMSNSKGDPMEDNLTPEQMLSEADALLETLSISHEQRQTVREKLASMLGAKAQPGYDSNKEAGEPGPIAETLSNTDEPKADEPKADEECSDGVVTPEVPAVEGLSDTGEGVEGLSSNMLGEFLSNLGMIFKGKMPAKMKAAAAAQKANHENNSNSAAGEQGQALSEGVGDVNIQGGEKTTMDEEQISQLVNQLFSTKAVELEQKFSTELAAKDEEINALKSQLVATQETAQQFSSSVADAAFGKRVNSAIEAGIPAVTVQAFAEIAKLSRGTVQKFSGGEMDVADAIFHALETLPGENRVQYGQIGQQFSDGEADPYADIMAPYNQAAK